MHQALCIHTVTCNLLKYLLQKKCFTFWVGFPHCYTYKWDIETSDNTSWYSPLSTEETVEILGKKNKKL